MEQTTSGVGEVLSGAKGRQTRPRGQGPCPAVQLTECGGFLLNPALPAWGLRAKETRPPAVRALLGGTESFISDQGPAGLHQQSRDSAGHLPAASSSPFLTRKNQRGLDVNPLPKPVPEQLLPGRRPRSLEHSHVQGVWLCLPQKNPAQCQVKGWGGHLGSTAEEHCFFWSPTRVCMSFRSQAFLRGGHSYFQQVCALERAGPKFPSH